MTSGVRIDVARKLVAQNAPNPNSFRWCAGTNCSGVECKDCPFSKSSGLKATMGDLREQVRAADHIVSLKRAGVKGGTSQISEDAVRKPSHYQVFDGLESIEVIARSMTVSEFRGFCMGNVLKYRLRAGKKSELATMEKDLNKAAFYQELFDLHKGKCYAD